MAEAVLQGAKPDMSSAAGVRMAPADVAPADVAPADKCEEY